MSNQAVELVPEVRYPYPAPDRDDWTEQAECAKPGVDPEIFFPEKGGTYSEARKVCGRCVVAIVCLNEAMRDKEIQGMRGGHSPRERDMLRRLVRE